MPEMTITQLEDVGAETVALTLETPSDFEAFPGQFVLVRASIDGDEETGYYTIASPDVAGTFTMTVAVKPDGTLGPWLAGREVGDTVTIEGPFGHVQYTGGESAVVFASGPGIGPAVGVGERARQEDRDVTIVYGGTHPPHTERLTALEKNDATIIIPDELHAAIQKIDFSNVETYIFGFDDFVEEVGKALSENNVDTSGIEMENFGSQ